MEKRKKRRWPWLLAALALVLILLGLDYWNLLPHRTYTAEHFGIETLQSPLDADGDGIDERNSHDGQIKTRLEAFFEVLEAKRAEGAAQGGNVNEESTAQGGTAETKGSAR